MITRDNFEMMGEKAAAPDYASRRVGTWLADPQVPLKLNK
jgi:hypothetical protein